MIGYSSVLYTELHQPALNKLYSERKNKNDADNIRDSEQKIVFQ